ncbi:P1 family peptidase [Streptomyces jeddahensis]|uniref:P1 family peptidase n=1 Tax=Streptomyces jeddahensis TaxID=1716141 RepID=UPI0018E3543C|nr:P1 family peptidase [Streptomyces jeddahensis]
MTVAQGASLAFDFPGLHVGVAEYAEGPTGCTVFYFPERATGVADVRGGLHATIYMDYLPHQEDVIDAICFAGGSLYGLEAATGVSAELLARRGMSPVMAKVAGAVCYDFHGRDNRVYPDKALGQVALRAAQPGRFPLGAHGAGRNTGCGGGAWFAGLQHETAGQGAAFRQIGPTKIGVFSVVNALGAIVDRSGRVVRGHLDPNSGQRHHYGEILDGHKRVPAPEPPEGNTTLTVVVINQKARHLGQLARQIHTSMARAIQPFHTEADGDILYLVTTNEVANEELNAVSLGVIASEVAWDAVLCSYDQSAAS